MKRKVFVNAEQMQSVYGLIYFYLVTLTLGNLKWAYFLIQGFILILPAM